MRLLQVLVGAAAFACGVWLFMAGSRAAGLWMALSGGLAMGKGGITDSQEGN